jgi:membrane protease YdiL (CAAX protease family)
MRFLADPTLALPVAWDHALAIVLTVVFPLRASLYGYRRLRVAAETDVPRLRLWLYRQAMVLQWSLVIATLALWAWQARPWVVLGLGLRITGGLIGVTVGVGIGVVFALRSRAGALADPEALARLRGRMSHIERMIPRSAQEASWFTALAVTAGICEELLYRGYLIWYLGHWLALLPAAFVASVIFGLGHLYQGPRGVATTTAAGAFLAMVYLITGSLYAGMVIHALMDLYAGNLMPRPRHTAPTGVDMAERRSRAPVRTPR